MKIKLSSFTPLMWFYLIMSVIGLVVPWYYNISEMVERGAFFTLSDWFNASMVSNLSKSAIFDFCIGITPFAVWMLVECRRLGMSLLFYFLAISICFAFCCPFFLLHRQIIINSKKS